MPKGMSLHIGVSKVDMSYYGLIPQLPGAPRDAKDMHDMAEKNKFKPKLLLNEKATRSAVLKAIADAAKKLETGDFFLITYSGHGGQFKVPGKKDTNEKDGKDETWCLFDEELIDDELFKLWNDFKKDVRIVMLSDSCHSGTMARAPGAKGTSKALPKEAQDKVIKEQLKKYLEKKKIAATKKNLEAQVLLLAACKDKQEALDLGFNGAFTNALKKSLAKETVTDYKSLLAEIKDNIIENKFSQTPAAQVLGNNPAVFFGPPFKI